MYSLIPVFNEETIIEANLNALEDYMNGYLDSKDWEIIVVNDGSTDKTLEVLNSVSQVEEWLKVIDLGFHYGRGKALREGIKASLGGIVVSLDADLSYAPYHIERMVSALKRENCDIVLASAYCKGGTVKDVPSKRLWISKIGNKILSYMFGEGLAVLTCVVRAYKSGFVKNLDLHSDDKEIHLEILYKAKVLNARIYEVPADLVWPEWKTRKRTSDKTSMRRSTIKIKDTSATHLFFALLNRPGMVFWVPGYILMFISFAVFLVTFKSMASYIAIGNTIYDSIRTSMMEASVSWLTIAFSFLLGIQFFTLGFLTSQNKTNYEEIYKTLNTIISEVKKKG